MLPQKYHQAIALISKYRTVHDIFACTQDDIRRFKAKDPNTILMFVDNLIRIREFGKLASHIMVPIIFVSDKKITKDRIEAHMQHVPESVPMETIEL